MTGSHLEPVIDQEKPLKAFEVFFGNTDMRVGGLVYAESKKQAKLKFALKLLQAEHTPAEFWNLKVRVVATNGGYINGYKKRKFFHPQHKHPKSGEWVKFGHIFRLKRVFNK